MKVIFLLGLALLGYASVTDAAADKVVCYFGSWSVYRPGNGKFDVEDIDPFICTHLMFGFVGLDEAGDIRVLDAWNELPDNWGKAAFRRFNDLKKINPSLKTLVAIGGWNEGSIKYSQTFRDPAKIDNFVRNSVKFLQTHGFDGLDLDWEYPNQRGGVPEDVESFTKLIRALRAEFNKHGYLLTAAVAAAEKSFSLSYNVPELSNNLDFINIMAYDFHGAWENITGHNAPIYISAVERGTEIEGYNADASIRDWIRYGAAPEKLVMGIGLYGRAFTLRSSTCNGPRCPASGPATAGPYTREGGMLGYNEICVNENAAGAQKFWDSEAMVPYLVFGNNQWVGYDDEESFRLKANYIKSKGLGGSMVWSIETDDFRGDCGKGRYPLLNILKSAFITGGAVPPPTTTTTTQAPSGGDSSSTAAPTTTTTTTTAAPGVVAPSDVCQFAGYNRDPVDCAVFYQCYVVNGEYKYSKFTCSAGTVFDPSINTCNHATKVQC